MLRLAIDVGKTVFHSFDFIFALIFWDVCVSNLLLVFENKQFTYCKQSAERCKQNSTNDKQYTDCISEDQFSPIFSKVVIYYMPRRPSCYTTVHQFWFRKHLPIFLPSRELKLVKKSMKDVQNSQSGTKCGKIPYPYYMKKWNRRRKKMKASVWSFPWDTKISRCWK